jgi:uncharacterized protein YkwD
VAQLPIPKAPGRLPLAIGLAAVLAAATAAGTGAAEWKSAGPATSRVTPVPRLETRLLDRINEVRRAAGLIPLRATPSLAAAAHEQSLSMAQHGFFSHESYGGGPYWKRVETRYAKPADGAWRVGENLVWGSPRLTARRALELWLSSPEHRQNLLTPAWREVGIAAVHASEAPGIYAGQDVTILTADFGVRG